MVLRRDGMLRILAQRSLLVVPLLLLGGFSCILLGRPVGRLLEAIGA